MLTGENFSGENVESGTQGNHHAMQQSYALQLVLIECHKYEQRNHFARVCHSNPQRQTSQGYTPSSETLLTKTMACTYIAIKRDDSDTKDWEVNIKVKIDNGVQCKKENLL